MQEDGNKLYDEDQALVDKVTNTGVHSIERKPFRPFRLLLVLVVIVTSFSLFSLYLARLYGVY